MCPVWIESARDSRAAVARDPGHGPGSPIIRPVLPHACPRCGQGPGGSAGTPHIQDNIPARAIIARASPGSCGGSGTARASNPQDSDEISAITVTIFTSMPYHVLILFIPSRQPPSVQSSHRTRASMSCRLRCHVMGHVMDTLDGPASRMGDRLLAGVPLHDDQPHVAAPPCRRGARPGA